MRQNKKKLNVITSFLVIDLIDILFPVWSFEWLYYIDNRTLKDF